MSRRVLLFLLALLAPLQAAVGEFDIRPVVPLDAAQLATLRKLVTEDPEAAALAARAAAEAQPLFELEARPLRRIRYEGLVNTDPQRIESVDHLRQMDAIAILVRHHQASGDPRAATALRRLVIAWADTYRPTGNDVNENKLVPLLVAWEALRDDSAAESRQRVDAWVEDLGRRHADAAEHSDHLTNRYTKHLRLAALCGLILERPEWLDLARAGVRRFVEHSLRADGGSLDFEHRDTLTYHCSALVPPLELGLLLDEPALYTWQAPSGASLQRSVAFVVPYARGEKTHAEWVDSQVGLDHRRAEAGLEKYRPGRLFDPVDARDLMTIASAFDPDLLPLALELHGGAAQRYADWQLLVNAAVTRARSERSAGDRAD